MRHTGHGLCRFPTSSRERTSAVLKRAADSQVDCHPSPAIVTLLVPQWHSPSASVAASASIGPLRPTAPVPAAPRPAPSRATARPIRSLAPEVAAAGPQDHKFKPCCRQRHEPQIPPCAGHSGPATIIGNHMRSTSKFGWQAYAAAWMKDGWTSWAAFSLKERGNSEAGPNGGPNHSPAQEAWTALPPLVYVNDLRPLALCRNARCQHQFGNGVDRPGIGLQGTIGVALGDE